MPLPRSAKPGHPVSKTQLKAQIPTNTQDHDFLVEVPTFEQFLDWYESRHLSIIPDSWSVCTRASWCASGSRSVLRAENLRIVVEHLAIAEAVARRAEVSCPFEPKLLSIDRP